MEPFAVVIDGQGMVCVFDAGMQIEIMVAMFPAGNVVDKGVDNGSRKAQGWDRIPNPKEINAGPLVGVRMDKFFGKLFLWRVWTAPCEAAFGAARRRELFGPRRAPCAM